METIIVDLKKYNLDANEFDKLSKINQENYLNSLKMAGEIIKKGGLVAFPTETVYGLGGDALNLSSSKRIYGVKGRPSDNPLIVHISDVVSVNKIASNITEKDYKIMDYFWPGPLTLIFNKRDIVPLETTGGLNTVAIRLPKNQIARDFIKYAGGYVAAPSANLSGKPSPTAAKHVIDDLYGKIEMIIDGGDGEIGLESTILDMTGDIPTILRPGFITKKQISEVIGEVEIDSAIVSNNSTEKPKAPGMKYRHYAPKAPLYIVSGKGAIVAIQMQKMIMADIKEKLKIGVIATENMREMFSDAIVKIIGNEQDENSIGHNLYKILREFDDENVDKIYSVAFENKGYGAAIMNRLNKAAGGNIINVN